MTSGRHALALVLAAAALAAATASSATDVRRGQAVAVARCGRCHALGLVEPSRDPRAPPFRQFGGTASVGDMVDSRARWRPPPHSGMPRFTLSDEDAEALKDFILAIQMGAGGGGR